MDLFVARKVFPFTCQSRVIVPLTCAKNHTRSGLLGSTEKPQYWNLKSGKALLTETRVRLSRKSGLFSGPITAHGHALLRWRYTGPRRTSLVLHFCRAHAMQSRDCFSTMPRSRDTCFVSAVTSWRHRGHMLSLIHVQTIWLFTYYCIQCSVRVLCAHAFCNCFVTEVNMKEGLFAATPGARNTKSASSILSMYSRSIGFSDALLTPK